MTKPTLTIPTVAAALLLGAAPLALAQMPGANGNAPNTAPTANTPATPTHQNQAMIQSFEKATVSLPQAIQTAQQRSKGKAIAAGFGTDPNGNPMYRITTYQNNSLAVHDIDGKTGKVVAYKSEIKPSELTQEGQKEVTAANNAKTPLLDAVKTAEQRNGGKAIGGGLEARNGEAFYEVTLLKSGQPTTVRVNPQNGQLAAVPMNRLDHPRTNSQNNPQNNPENNPEESNPQNNSQSNPGDNSQSNGLPSQR